MKWPVIVPDQHTNRDVWFSETGTRIAQTLAERGGDQVPLSPKRAVKLYDC